MTMSPAASPPSRFDPRLSPPVDEVGVLDRVDRLGKRSIKNESKLEALRMILGMIDLTTLEGADTPGRVRQLCAKARRLHDDAPLGLELPQVAAVCVYPTMVAEAKSALRGTNIRVASVATAFPSGQAPLAAKLADTRAAVEAGADEVDMVISRGRFLAGEYEYVFDEIAAIKEACGGAHLKVILETGELGPLDVVRRASDLAIAAGADFIKTSTGKLQPAATLPVTLVMLQAIRDHHDATGNKVGMKPAGGISNSKTALRYLVLVRETLGQAWLTPELFRIGASTLANDVLQQIVKQKTGVYQAAEYFALG